MLVFMKKVDQRMCEIAANQYQVVTRQQFLEFGTRDQITRRLKNGQYVRTYDGVYRMAGSTPSYEQDLCAAVLAGAPLAAGSFRAAAHFLDLPGGRSVR